MPTFYKHPERSECKVHRSFKEIGQKYQSYGFKNIYSKSAQWMDLYDKYNRMKYKYVRLRRDSFDCTDFLRVFLQRCFDDVAYIHGDLIMFLFVTNLGRDVYMYANIYIYILICGFNRYIFGWLPFNSNVSKSHWFQVVWTLDILQWTPKFWAVSREPWTPDHTRATFETSNYPRHQIVNALELSTHPLQKKEKWKTLHSSNRPGWKNWSHCEKV